MKSQKDNNSTNFQLNNLPNPGVRNVDLTNELGSCLEQGQAYFEKNDYNNALIVFRKILELDPDNKPAKFKIGEINYRLGRYEEAIKELRKVVEIDKENKKLYMLLALSYKENKQYNKALQEFEKASKLSMGDKEFESMIYVEIGEIYIKLENYGLAIESLFKGIGLGHSNAYIHYLIGKAYRLSNKYDEALNEFNKVMKIGNQGVKNDTKYEVLNLIKNSSLDANDTTTIGIIEKISKFHENINSKEKYMFDNAIEIAGRKLRLTSKPRTINVQLTNECNLRCKLCPDSESPKVKISARVKDEIIKMFPYLERAIWCGGEVFLYPEFNELLDEAIRNNVRQTIMTTLFYLDEKTISKLVSNNVELVISVDGATKEIYEAIREGASYELLIKNLELINNLRKSMNLNYKFIMHTVLMKSNYRQIEDFVEFAKRYNFSALTFNRLNCFEPNKDEVEDIYVQNRNNDILAYIDKALKKAKVDCRRHNIEFNSSIPEEVFQNNLNRNNDLDVNDKSRKNENKSNGTNKCVCFAPWKYLSIDYYGDVKPIAHCLCNNVVGNLNTESMDEIWNNDNMIKYRRNILSGDIKKVCNLNKIYNNIPYETLRY